MKTFLLLFLAAFSPMTIWAESPLKILTSIPEFAFGGIGVAGTTSNGEIAFRELWKNPTGERDFLQILQSGSSAGKCYALVALRRLDPAGYSDLAKPLRGDRTEVTTIGGCMIMPIPLATVVQQIDAGVYDRVIPEEP